ncbi:MAG: glycogen debranching enzyme GlgX, partial [Rhodococcus sp. (in: high G+C Gram-positive bacteria)]
ISAWVDGSDVRSYASDGGQVDDASSLLILHSGGPAEITLACPSWSSSRFVPVLDSSRVDGVPPDTTALEAGSKISVTGSTVLVFRSAGR